MFPRTFLNLRSRKCHFLRFPQDSKVNEYEEKCGNLNFTLQRSFLVINGTSLRNMEVDTLHDKNEVICN